jgi:DNA polymerase-3 subunit delta
MASDKEADALVAAAGTRPSPAYLLIGEPFQTETLARRLIDAIVPAERRSVNLETYDGRTAAIGPILDSLRTLGLFRGTKLIWVREPTLFLSGEKRADLAKALFEAWADERPADAAERLLTLAAMAGWSQAQLMELDPVTAPQSTLSELLGQTADGEERQVLAAARAYCLERNLTVGAFRDDSGLLQELLLAGMPAESVLLFTASTVDRRKKIVTLLRERGTVVELALARERSGALTAESVEQLVAEVVARAGKRLTPGAQRAVVQRAGGDPAAVAMELEKLCLYAGEAATITEEDVRTSFRDMAESWIFDFTRALAQRQPAAAIRLLRALFEQGEHPLRLLALIAREVRVLLLARDCLTGPAGQQWKAGMQFAAFKDRVVPLLTDDQREALGNIHPYALYQSLQNAGRMRTFALHRAVLALQDLDRKMKSSLGDPHTMIEAFVLDLCRA